MRRGTSLAAAVGFVGVVLVASCGGSDLFSNSKSTSTTNASTSTTSDSGGSSSSTQGGGGQTGTGGETQSGGSGGMSTSTGNQGDPCDWLGGPCNEGLFCNAPGCTAGSCQPTLTPEQQQQHLDAQCGCDGISYFNPSVAESKAMSLAHPGPCGENEAIACDKMTPCPGDLHCNLRIQNLSQCFFSPGAKFTCWAVPNECDPKSALGHSCASVLPNDCDDICSLIKSKDAWYEDIGCK